MVVLLLMQLQPFTVLIRWLYCIVTSFTSCLHDIQFSHIIIMTWEITCILQDITWICLLLSLEQRHRDMQNYGCLNSALTVEWACIRSINGKKNKQRVTLVCRVVHLKSLHLTSPERGWPWVQGWQIPWECSVESSLVHFVGVSHIHLLLGPRTDSNCQSHHQDRYEWMNKWIMCQQCNLVPMLLCWEWG